MPYYTAIVTLLAVARGKVNVQLPATTGNPDFEWVFRVQMNTLEWMPTFLVVCLDADRGRALLMPKGAIPPARDSSLPSVHVKDAGNRPPRPHKKVRR